MRQAQRHGHSDTATGAVNGPTGASEMRIRTGFGRNAERAVAVLCTPRRGALPVWPIPRAKGGCDPGGLSSMS